MEISSDWLSSCLQRDVRSVSVESMGSAGGLNCQMMRLHVVFETESDTMVLKTIREDGQEKSRNLGLAREALFYRAFANHLELKTILAKVLYSHGDLETGQKEIILEDLKDGIQSGYFFGAFSPLNWGKDLSKETKGVLLSATEVAKLAAQAAARLHAAFWKDAALEGQWIRGLSWVSGGGEDLWQEGQWN